MKKNRASCASARVGLVVLAAFGAACGGIVGPEPVETFDGNKNAHDGGAHGGHGGGGGGGGFGGFAPGDDDAGSSGESGGTFGDDDSGLPGVVVDAGIGDDDSDGAVFGDAAAGAGGSGQIYGEIDIDPDPPSRGPRTGIVTAAFFTEPATSPSCAAQQVNASCVVTICAPGMQPSRAPHVASAAQAGPIDVRVSGTLNVLTYQNGAYDVGSFDSSKTGGTVLIHALGAPNTGLGSGAIPAFAFTLLEPGVPTVTAPVASAMTGAAAFPRSSDLVLQWSGGVPGTSLVADVTASNDGASTRIECTFDQGAGQGLVPAAGGLSELPVVDGTTSASGTIVYTYSSSRTLTAGPAIVTATEAFGPDESVQFTTTN